MPSSRAQWIVLHSHDPRHLPNKAKANEDDKAPDGANITPSVYSRDRIRFHSTCAACVYLPFESASCTGTKLIYQKTVKRNTSVLKTKITSVLTIPAGPDDRCACQVFNNWASRYFFDVMRFSSLREKNGRVIKVNLFGFDFDQLRLPYIWILYYLLSTRPG